MTDDAERVLEIADSYLRGDSSSWEVADPIMRDLCGELRSMRDRKDSAYLERNQVVAALAKCFPSGVARTAIEGWSDDWHGCVYIDLPTGQVSWHFHDSHAHLFAFLPPYAGSWDGHDTSEKYRRLASLPRTAPPDPQDVSDELLDKFVTAARAASNAEPHSEWFVFFDQIAEAGRVIQRARAAQREGE